MNFAFVASRILEESDEKNQLTLVETIFISLIAAGIIVVFAVAVHKILVARERALKSYLDDPSRGMEMGYMGGDAYDSPPEDYEDDFPGQTKVGDVFFPQGY
mmetsp:Transcript_56133/g.112459  ORF Transcript_56133/g.112459 Transcript_56133/m.112459 type:complete len:102 (-) Transcript_56133:224-529(-)|eukprot:CAMPEP_0171626348 /NCGR_PEP_ID=MMETSP0990-20121206/19978_1 /TAXON_ID=483369 /ORGANISM="non described non described, Strain CCMP2098" /LENGTH=101 /DNA_ID=CAMNT_0012193705 /DNA_START=103 /DNA_END=408 /DNA_ORIENTATION=+